MNYTLYLQYKGDWYSNLILKIYRTMGFWNYSKEEIIDNNYTKKIVGRILSNMIGYKNV